MERHHKQEATESDFKTGNPDESHKVVKFVKGMCSRLQLNFSLTAKTLHPSEICVNVTIYYYFRIYVLLIQKGKHNRVPKLKS